MTDENQQAMADALISYLERGDFWLGIAEGFLLKNPDFLNSAAFLNSFSATDAKDAGDIINALQNLEFIAQKQPSLVSKEVFSRILNYPNAVNGFTAFTSILNLYLTAEHLSDFDKNAYCKYMNLLIAKYDIDYFNIADTANPLNILTKAQTLGNKNYDSRMEELHDLLKVKQRESSLAAEH